MDFLDPDKVRRHNLMVLIGYSLVGIAIAIAALVLLYQSYGYGINRDGEVIQNGLVFTASNPDGASIWLNSNDSGFRTDKRLVLAAGDYLIQYNKDGYWPWARSIHVAGSGVSRYDYAFLFPRELETTAVKDYAATPSLSTQSPDRHWLLVQLPGDTMTFDEYDLTNPTQLPAKLTIPSALVSSGTDSSWQTVEWSKDNRHVLLEHTYGKSSEFILFDRDTPARSVNLNKTLKTTPTSIRLINLNYDRYYVYTESDQVLRTASLSDISLRSYLKNVLAFEPFGDRTVLYVTDDIKETSETAGLVAAKLTDGARTYTIRQMAPSKTYLLGMANFAGNPFVAVGSGAESKVIVYKNPVKQITDPSLGVPVQVSTLKVDAPSFVSFSPTGRFVAAENGGHFAVYDAFEDRTYTYGFDNGPDKPQKHATWMDADRLMYVSDGKLFVFDYDQTNRRDLMPASPAYVPAFTPNFKQVFALAPQTAQPSKLQMTSTWMLIPADR